MEILRLEDLEIYQLSLEVGEDVWGIVYRWDGFSKNTTGRQFVNAANSISSNIAEGSGRYFYKDRKMFCYYSRGSLMETKNWAIKALKRRLLGQEEYDALLSKLQVLHHKLSIYIKKSKNSASTPPIS